MPIGEASRSELEGSGSLEDMELKDGELSRLQFVLEIDISSCLFSSTFICRGKNDYTGWLYSKQIWNLLTAVVCCVTT